MFQCVGLKNTCILNEHVLLSYPRYCITPLNQKTLYSLQKKFFVLKSYNCPIWICVAGLIGKAHLIRLSHTIVPLRLTNQRRRWSWKVRAEVRFFRPHGRIHKLSSGPNCSNTDFARVHFTWPCPWCLFWPIFSANLFYFFIKCCLWVGKVDELRWK